MLTKIKHKEKNSHYGPSWNCAIIISDLMSSKSLCQLFIPWNPTARWKIHRSEHQIKAESRISIFMHYIIYHWLWSISKCPHLTQLSCPGCKCRKLKETNQSLNFPLHLENAWTACSVNMLLKIVLTCGPVSNQPPTLYLNRLLEGLHFKRPYFHMSHQGPQRPSLIC